MAIIIRSITNNTPYTLSLKVPSLEQNLSPITVASHTTLDLLTVVTEDDLIAMQLYLQGMVSRGNLTVAATIDTSSFESGYTGAATWGSINGTLSSQTDLQTALNGKQPTGSYITALTGDVTASGPGSASATLANTSVTPGSYTNTNITVDSKGRITAASNGSSSGANTTLSNLTSPTALNQDILPSSDNGRSLGSSSLQFGTVYTYNVNSNNDDLDLTSAFNVYLASGVSSDIILNAGSGHINADTHNITNMADPVSAQDAATKNYVDTHPTPPAGANTQIQYNNSGVFGASPNLVWNNTNNTLGVSGTSTPTTPMILVQDSTPNSGNPALEVVGGIFSYDALTPTAGSNLSPGNLGTFNADGAFTTLTEGIISLNSATGQDSIVELVPENLSNLGWEIQAIHATGILQLFPLTFNASALTGTQTGQIGIHNDTPAASAVLDIVSTTQGFLPPRMTAAQRTGISSPAEGLIVYDTDNHAPYFWNGSSWIAF